MKLLFNTLGYKFLPPATYTKVAMHPYVNNIIDDKSAFRSMWAQDAHGTYIQMDNGWQIPLPYDEGKDCTDGLCFEVVSTPDKCKHSYGFFEIEAGDVVIDGGAYEGLFSAMCYDKGAITFSVEPETTAFNKILHTTCKINKALNDYDGKIPFFNERFASTTSTHRIMGHDFIEAITIDTLLKEHSNYYQKNTLEQSNILIKLDVEGAELQALIGAHDTIANYRPKIIAETYHDGIFSTFTANTICEYLRKLQPDYNILLWGYSHNYSVEEYAVHAVIAW